MEIRLRVSAVPLWKRLHGQGFFLCSPEGSKKRRTPLSLQPWRNAENRKFRGYLFYCREKESLHSALGFQADHEIWRHCETVLQRGGFLQRPEQLHPGEVLYLIRQAISQHEHKQGTLK